MPVNRNDPQNRLKPITVAKCLQATEMLVPKFACEAEGDWHIHWPKDQPTVVHAQTEKQLVIKRATWLLQIGRVGNQTTHVGPVFTCPRCNESVLYPKVQAVYEEFAKKYGWGEVTSIKFQTEKK